MRRYRFAAAAAALLLCAAPLGSVSAQQAQEAVSRGFDLERRGDYTAAVTAYREALERRPGDLGALLGLERALVTLGRGAEAVAPALAALEGSNDSSVVYSVLVRSWVAAAEPDSAAAAAERWAALMPGEEAPYRELGNAYIGRRDVAGARRAFELGRERTGRPEALAPELASLAVQQGDYVASVPEWLLAVREVPGYRLSALTALTNAPESSRADILDRLRRDSTPGVRQLEAGLRARWGDPEGGFAALSATLGADRVRAAEALREFLEIVRPQRTPAGRRAMGRTLEALAERVPDAQAQRLRSEAAQAYADGGDRDGARRVLGELAGGRGTPETVAAGAATTLVGVLVDEGKIEEAAERLEAARDQLPSEDYLELRRRIALGHARRGDLDRADSLIASDRSVEGIALAGRLALYRGDIAGAETKLREAGPFAGGRAAATERAALLALLQPIEADSLPALGEAFLALERGDTTAAAAAFEAVAGTLAPEAGGAELSLVAGRLARAQGRAADAERLFRSSAGASVAATAPAAGLELARLLIAAGRRDEAVATLENLILTWPQSALVPQARRLLDEARGAVPST